MKRNGGLGKKVGGCLLILLFSILGQGAASAETVSQLNITGGSIALDLTVGANTVSSIAGGFSQNGTLLMGTFQPSPEILPPLLIDGHTFSFFTDSSEGILPAPSGQISGTIITADLSSMFAQFTGPTSGTLNIGGLASGSYDPGTGAFHLSWIHVYDVLATHSGTLDGNVVYVSPVPLPAAAWLFGTGLLSLGGIVRRYGVS
ncbi:MAG: hypothetical protein HY760_07730 [Nitrospirae bacterium]|nr:hypothetical protein [Nitrospirota bacterium]